MNFHRVITILTAFLFIGCYALEYSLLENLQITCSSRDNCKLIENHENSFGDRNCECDNQCNEFHDCCIDKANLSSLALSRTKKYPCMTFGDKNKVGIYVIDTCSHNYRTSSTIQSLCRKGNEYSDPLVSAPVTVVSTGTTFKNRYCAECNGVSPSSLQSWLVHLSCETLNPFQLNDRFIWQRIKYNPSLRTWGVEFDGEFHRCEMIFDKPDNLTAVRFCRANTIDKCPSSFPGKNVKRLCASYSALVYDTVNSYKNPHCAICNNKSVKHLSCLDPNLRRSAKFRFPFILNPDRNLRNETNNSRCPSGEIWDPFFKKCRKQTCVLPGYKLVEGKCRKRVKNVEFYRKLGTSKMK